LGNSGDFCIYFYCFPLGVLNILFLMMDFPLGVFDFSGIFKVFSPWCFLFSNIAHVDLILNLKCHKLANDFLQTFCEP
jgi:hypothetical protein